MTGETLSIERRPITPDHLEKGLPTHVEEGQRAVEVVLPCPVKRAGWVHPNDRKAVEAEEDRTLARTPKQAQTAAFWDDDEPAQGQLGPGS